TQVGNGVFRAPRPYLRDCNDNGVIDFLEVAYKPLGLSEPEAISVSDRPVAPIQGDFDGDGAIDLAVASETDNVAEIRFNDGNGAYPAARRVELSVTSASSRMAAGDFNGDGVLDLAVAHTRFGDDEITVFLNDPAAPGTFPDIQQYLIGDSENNWIILDMVAVDLDARLGKDLAVVAYTTRYGGIVNLYALSSNAAGRFDIATYSDLWIPDTGTAAIAAGDVDQDGDQDLVLGAGERVAIARNDGSGSLRVPPDSSDPTSADSSFAGLGYRVAGVSDLAVADLDRDGYPEFGVANSSGDNLIILPNISADGAIRFDLAHPRVIATPSPRSIAFQDIDGDGLTDILVDGPALDQVAVFVALGDLTFEAVPYEFDVGATVNATMTAELNGVNPPEIVALSTDADRLTVFFNESRISVDCNTNRVPDACDIARGDSADCNANDVPDECDVAHLIGLTSRPVWKHDVYNSDWEVRRFETVEETAPLLGPYNYDAALGSVDLDQDNDNELIVMNTWTGEFTRYLFNLDYGDFTVMRNPSELMGSSAARLRDYLYFDLGVQFLGEKVIAMTTGEFTGDSREDLAIISLSTSTVGEREVGVTALKIVAQGREEMSTTWTTGTVLYEQSNPRLPPMRHVIAADFDLDGDDDLAVTPDVISSDLPYDPGLDVEFKIVLLRNDGDGVFHHDPDRDITLRGAVTSIDAKDLNRDGRPEIIVTDYSYPEVTVCHNLPADDGFAFASRCRHYDAGTIPLAVKAGDLDGDGFADLVVANDYTNHISVLHNSPLPGIDPSADLWQENFDAPVSERLLSTGDTVHPKDLALVDLDLDGDLDVITANWGNDTVSVLRNAGDGSFLTPMAFAAGYRPEAVHVTKLDRDERPDIAVGNGSGAVTIMLNRSVVPSSEDADRDGRPDACGD
ncbi:MAG: VCBS repeat-containing protein, partial [Sedimenticolaceae bacterium]